MNISNCDLTIISKPKSVKGALTNICKKPVIYHN